MECDTNRVEEHEEVKDVYVEESSESDIGEYPENKWFLAGEQKWSVIYKIIASPYIEETTKDAIFNEEYAKEKSELKNQYKD